LNNEAVLSEYKEPQSTERGFGFLKDPLFFADSVFLKDPGRIAAVGMVMGLCLLVYNLGQRTLRQALVQADESLSNQLKKPTQRPTLRWIFQCFQAVHLLVIDGVKQIANLTDERKRDFALFLSSLPGLLSIVLSSPSSLFLFNNHFNKVRRRRAV
jgi:transposase